MHEVSVIVRARNEEKWIRHCLEAVLGQNHSSFEIIVIDNSSQDKTVEIASRFAGVRVLPLSEYTPGGALNFGVEQALGEKIAFISAHCIPIDQFWLERLEEAFSLTEPVAGVYGRQWPMRSSSANTVSDLTNLFGPEVRVQKKDPLFHNANSMILKSMWDEQPFDSSVKNLEDRVWSQQMLDRGRCLVYQPSAGVFHHDGLHRDSDPDRARGQVQVIQEMQGGFIEVPFSIRPEQALVVPIIPFLRRHLDMANFETQVKSVLSDLGRAGLSSSSIFVGPEGVVDALAGAKFISRDSLQIDDSSSLDDLMRQAALILEETHQVPDYYLYVNLEYSARPEGFIGQLIETAREGAFETVFGASEEYGHIWAEGPDGRLTNISPEIKSRSFSKPSYRAHYGLGTLVSASSLRDGSLVGSSVGIVPLPEGFEVHRARVDGFGLSKQSS